MAIPETTPASASTSQMLALTPIAAAYQRGQGYNGIGVTANIDDAWSPCRNDTIYGTWWRYSCNPVSGKTGEVQTYYYTGTSNLRRAIMWQTGTSSTPAYIMWGGIFEAYVQLWNGQDWVYWIGYPTSDTGYFSNGNYHIQTFQSGFVIWYPATCRVEMYISGPGLQAVYSFCP